MVTATGPLGLDRVLGPRPRAHSAPHPGSGGTWPVAWLGVARAHTVLQATEAGQHLRQVEPGLALHPSYPGHSGASVLSRGQPTTPEGSPLTQGSAQTLSPGLWRGRWGWGWRSPRYTGSSRAIMCPVPGADTCPGTTLPLPPPPWPGIRVLLVRCPGRSLSRLGLQPLGALCPTEPQRQPGPGSCGFITILPPRTWGPPS